MAGFSLGNLFYDVDVRDHNAEAKLTRIAEAATRSSNTMASGTAKATAAQKKQEASVDALVRRYEALRNKQGALVGQTAQYGHMVTFLNNAAAITGSRFIALGSKIAGMTGAYRRMSASINHAKKEMNELTAAIIAQGAATRIGLPAGTKAGSAASLASGAGSIARIGTGVGVGMIAGLVLASSAVGGSRMTARGRDRWNDVIDKQLTDPESFNQKWLQPIIGGLEYILTLGFSRSISDSNEARVKAYEDQNRAADAAAKHAEILAQQVQMLSIELKSATAETKASIDSMRSHAQIRRNIEEELASNKTRGEAGGLERKILEQKLLQMRVARGAEGFGKIGKMRNEMSGVRASRRAANVAGFGEENDSLGNTFKIEAERQRSVKDVERQMRETVIAIKAMEAMPAEGKAGTLVARRLEMAHKQFARLQASMADIDRAAQSKQSADAVAQFQREFSNKADLSSRSYKM